MNLYLYFKKTINQLIALVNNVKKRNAQFNSNII